MQEKIQIASVEKFAQYQNFQNIKFSLIAGLSIACLYYLLQFSSSISSLSVLADMDLTLIPKEEEGI